MTDSNKNVSFIIKGKNSGKLYNVVLENSVVWIYELLLKSYTWADYYNTNEPINLIGRQLCVCRVTFWANNTSTIEFQKDTTYTKDELLDFIDITDLVEVKHIRNKEI